MSNVFQTVKVQKPKRNVFDLSHDRKFSSKMGLLTPILCTPVLPGDKFNINVSSMVRFAPMIAPVMHRVQVFTHYYFVPNRILWNNWEDFITSGLDGLQSPEHPFIKFVNDDPELAVEPSSIADYLGIPLLPNDGLSPQKAFKADALPFYAYAKVWNDYFADENLNEQLIDKAIDGNNDANYKTNFYSLSNNERGKPLKRAWRHDYFTSCLPFAQKGPSVMLPLGDTAPIVFNEEAINGIGTRTKFATNGDNISGTNDIRSENISGGSQTTLSGSVPIIIDNSQHLEVDLSDATANSINDLRRAYALQRWLEKNAYGGTRYTEQIKVHFGVNSSDARLQRSEFLGGTRSNVMISEVLQNTQPINENDTPQGNMSGHGIAVGDGFASSRFFEEHGWIIGIMSVMPEPAYQQGLSRLFTKFDRFDYFWPDFAHIGEQAVLNRELYAQGTDVDEEVFGYIPRYSEYKYIGGSVHGDFKDVLSFWHMGRYFENTPALNADFIACTPTDNIFAVQNLPPSDTVPSPLRDWDTLYVHVWHSIKAIRPIPYYSVPI